jgi:hypothetical protein
MDSELTARMETILLHDEALYFVKLLSAIHHYNDEIKEDQILESCGR